MSLGRRVMVGVVVSGAESGDFRTKVSSYGSGPSGLPAHSRSSRLPLPAPMRHAAAASDWEPGWPIGSGRSESAGLRRPLGLTRGPRAGHLPRRGVPLREQHPWVGGPLCRLGAPFPSRASWPHVGQGPVQADSRWAGESPGTAWVRRSPCCSL
jgi:hypothetical protein